MYYKALPDDVDKSLPLFLDNKYIINHFQTKIVFLIYCRCILKYNI